MLRPTTPVIEYLELLRVVSTFQDLRRFARHQIPTYLFVGNVNFPPGDDVLMDLAMEEPEKDLMLDFYPGFPHKLTLDMESHGVRMLAYRIAFHAWELNNDDKNIANLARAFGEGLLEIADENHSTVLIDYPTDFYYLDSMAIDWCVDFDGMQGHELNKTDL